MEGGHVKEYDEVEKNKLTQLLVDKIKETAITYGLSLGEAMVGLFADGLSSEDLTRIAEFARDEGKGMPVLRSVAEAAKIIQASR